MGEYQEVEEDRRTGENRRKSDQWSRLLVENIGEGLAVQDEKGSFVYVNPALCRMLGYSSEEILGKHYSKFFDEANQAIIEEQLLQRREGSASPYEITWTAKDRQNIFTIVSPQPLFDKAGCFNCSGATL